MRGKKNDIRSIKLRKLSVNNFIMALGLAAQNQLHSVKEKRNAPRTNDFMGVADTLYGLNQLITIQIKMKGLKNPTKNPIFF